MAEENKVEENVGQIDTLKERLLSVSNEIDAIKTSFNKNAEDLSRIQNMLSVGNLEQISGIIEQFETRVSAIEKEKMEAVEGAKKYNEELEKEKERLIKLWDAYKNQEEELSTTEKKMNEYEEKLRTFEASKKQLEEDYNARLETLNKKLVENQEKVNQFDDYKQRCTEFDQIRNNLEQEIHTLKEQNKTREEQINSMTQELETLKNQESYEEYKNKYEEINAQYEKEKERLTKLYQLYEETDSEVKKLREENNSWQDWYNSNKEIFEKIFSSGPPMGRTTPKVNKGTKTNEIFPESSFEVDTPNDRKPDKKKKKLRFKK